MFVIVLNVALLLFLCLLSLAAGASVGAELQEEVQVQVQVLTESEQDCTLQCTARRTPGDHYIAARWFKVQGDAYFGLVTKNLPDGRTRRYAGLGRDVELDDESLSISLPNVTCGDGGLYQCYLAASVGQQNREGFVRLTVTDCPVSATEAWRPPNFSFYFPSAMVIVALVTLSLSYGCLKKTVKEKEKTVNKQIFLDAPLKPLDKKDLMLIATLGPKKCTMKHVFV